MILIVIGMITPVLISADLNSESYGSSNSICKKKFGGTIIKAINAHT